MSALLLDRNVLARVIDASGDRRAGSPAGGSSAGAVVTIEVIRESTSADGRCRCQDEETMAKLGLPVLRPGILVSELHTLAGGCCTGRWICPSLDSLRRRYGK